MIVVRERKVRDLSRRGLRVITLKLKPQHGSAINEQDVNILTLLWRVAQKIEDRVTTVGENTRFVDRPP